MPMGLWFSITGRRLYLFYHTIQHHRRSVYHIGAHDLMQLLVLQCLFEISIYPSQLRSSALKLFDHNVSC